MTNSEIIRYRLLNQNIAENNFTKPDELISYLGAMQAQEYPMAKWAIGLRIPGIKDSDVEQAFNEGKILRTHLMRPTWHFVTPADIRWLLKLTAPRVHTVNSHIYRKLELDSKLFKKSNKLLEKILDGKQLTRDVIKAELEKAKIKTEQIRLAFILMYAELEGIICSGGREGKKFTYALLDEKAPVNNYNKEEALAKLTKLYFTSRGPATIKDFSWWSGLTIKEIKDGIASLPPDFITETINGQEFIFIPRSIDKKKKVRSTFIFPDYDEYGISYKDRSVLKVSEKKPGYEEPNEYSHWLVVDGKISGTWKRFDKNGKVEAEVYPFIELNKTQLKALNIAVKMYIMFWK